MLDQLTTALVSFTCTRMTTTTGQCGIILMQHVMFAVPAHPIDVHIIGHGAGTA